jgi:hypothetical protein
MLNFCIKKLWIPDVIVIILCRNFNAIKAIKMFSLRKNVTLPNLAVLHDEISRHTEEIEIIS